MNQHSFNANNMMNPVMATDTGFKPQFQFLQQKQQITPNHCFPNFTSFDQNQKLIKINDKEYIKDKLLGKGTFGEVHLLKLKGTDEQYALKIQPYIVPNELEILKILKKKKFQNVVNTIEVQQNPNGKDYFVLMEYCECSLQDEIDEKKIDSKESRYIIKQITNGIKELHSENIIHRDLKPENILVFYEKDNKLKQKIYKICDFGLSSTKEISQTYKCGTAHYMAREQIAKLKQDDIGYDYSVDIWALGTIIYEIFSGQVLFLDKSKEAIYQQILTITQEELNEKIRHGLSNLECEHVNLVISMVQIDPKKRIKIEVVLKQLKSLYADKITKSNTDGNFQIPQSNQHSQKPQLSPQASKTGNKQNFQQFSKNFQQKQQMPNFHVDTKQVKQI